MDRTNCRAYTLIEVMIVLAVSAMIAVVIAYGLRAQDQSQLVINAQRDFVSNLRAAQNNVRNGVNGQAVRSVVITDNTTSYTIVNASVPFAPQTVQLPTGVTMTFTGSATQAICFANDNLTSYTTTAKCASSATGLTFCSSGQGYICVTTNASSPTNLDVNFSNSTVTKTVRVEGSGMTVARVYATN